MRRTLVAAIVIMGALGCRPDLGDPESLITSERILAVRADPPEAKPGDVVSYRALVASPRSTLDERALEWAFCTSPKPLTENDAVNIDCLGDGGAVLGAPAPTIDAMTPLDACELFGPDPPPGAYRPRDPDATGGFYQPVRVRLGSLTAIDLERVTCNLPNAPLAVAIDFEKRYAPNRNPTLTPLAATLEGASVALNRVPAGGRVWLAIGWRAGDAEPYVMFDPDTATITDRRESLRVSWFTTAGSLSDEVTGRGEDDPATDTGVTWTAPADRGTVHLWLVLHDSRGGLDFASYDLEVE